MLEGSRGASESRGPHDLPPNLWDFPSLLSRCQPGPFKDIPEGVAFVTYARGMNEHEPVLTQLPLKTPGKRCRSCARSAGEGRTRRPACGRAGVRERAPWRARSAAWSIVRPAPTSPCFGAGCWAPLRRRAWKVSVRAAAARAPLSRGGLTAGPPRPPEPGAPLRVRLWKPTWRRPVRRAEVGRATGLRSGLNWDPRLVM